MRVLLAEDEVTIVVTLKDALEGAGHVVVHAADTHTAITALERDRPDVVITDIRMPPTHTDEGVRAAAVIRAELPDTGVLVLSQYVRESYALELLGESATGVGYLLKDRVMEPHGFVEAVRQVARGGSVLDPEVVAHMLDRRRSGGPIDALSERELDALALMAQGMANAPIAAALGISEHTLQRHISSVFVKLDLPVSSDDHRRVLAVLTYLRAQED